MTNTIKLTPEHKRRIEQSIVEYQELLDRELSISEDLQYADKVQRYRENIAKLGEMLTQTHLSLN